MAAIRRVFWALLLLLLSLFATLGWAKTAAELVTSQINEHAVMLFSKTYCPFCKNIKKLLDEHQADYFVIELDTMDNGLEVQEAIVKLTSQSTVPVLFIDGKHIGGFSKAKELNQQGTLEKLLRDAAAIKKKSEL